MARVTLYSSSVATPDDRPNDGYDDLLDLIRITFSKSKTMRLFTTGESDLYSTFLMNLPAEARQHYNCRACRTFINKYGGLVFIDPKTGKTESAIFPDVVPPFFKRAISTLKEKVEARDVTGVFITDMWDLGVRRTGIWKHMSVTLPDSAVYSGNLSSASQEMAKKREDYDIVKRAINQYSAVTVSQAASLLESGSLYRGLEILDQANWFLYVYHNVKRKKNWKNKLWSIVAEAPTGFCHIPSSVFGSLLDDISAGYDMDAVKSRFEEKMNPLKYQRPQSLPGVQNIKRAEEIIEKLGLERSLHRRYARLEEVKTIWRPKRRGAGTGVFSNVPTKDNGLSTAKVHGATRITFEKFARTVLPSAQKIEMDTPEIGNYGAILTAVYPDSPPIIQWDYEDERNPFSWYLFTGGSSKDMWNLRSGWNEVSAICHLPHMWSKRPSGRNSKGAMLILNGARPMAMPHSACLFPEILKGDLHEVRKTIEAYSNRSKLESPGFATACGIIIQDTKHSVIRVRVTATGGIVCDYVIDRFD